MSIPLPELDTLEFTELMADARRLIPTLALGWTDHNASDPGITLLELFAGLTEMLSWRAGRVSADARRAYLALLRGPDHVLTAPVDEELRLALRDLAHERRAVTAADFEARACALPGVGRACCVPRRNLAAPRGRGADAPAHVSLVVLPAEPALQDLPAAKLLRLVERALAPLCLLTTRLHVVAPVYLPLALRLHVAAGSDQAPAALRARIEDRLRAFFAPLPAAPGHTPWPFGRAVYVSDVLACVDAVPGVDHAGAPPGQPLLSTTLAGRDIAEAGSQVGLRLEPGELVALQTVDIALQPLRPTP